MSEKKQETATAPVLRFKGFTEPWRQRKLGEIADVVDGDRGINYPSSNAFHDYGHTLFLNANNVTSNGFSFNNNQFITEDKSNSMGNGRVQLNDIVLTSRGSLGHVALYDKKIGEKYPYVRINSGMLILRCNSEFHTSFILQRLKSSLGQRQIKLISFGSAQPQLTKKDVSAYLLFAPEKFLEQKKIGEFFNHIDVLVTFHQHKCEKLQEIKKGLLQKMFPAEGSDVPEIRFAGFTDTWKQRKLLDCIEKVIDFRGRTPKKLGLDWSDNGYLALSALNVKNGYIDFSADQHYGNQELYDRWMSGNDLKKGQVLFTTEAPMGNIAQVPHDNQYILSQRTIAFKVQENIISDDFLAVVLSSPEIQLDLKTRASGGTAKGISQKSLSEIYLRVPPKLEEQLFISKLFQGINTTITLHQRKAEKLKELKKGLLQQLFI